MAQHWLTPFLCTLFICTLFICTLDLETDSAEYTARVKGVSLIRLLAAIRTAPNFYGSTISSRTSKNRFLYTDCWAV